MGNNVEEDPFDDDTAEHILADEEDNVELDCPVTGNPVPHITWLKLKYAGHYVDEVLPNNSTKLVIKFFVKIKPQPPSKDEHHHPPHHNDISHFHNLTVSFLAQIISNITDFSTYTCYANSSFGEIKLVFHITVHKPPRLMYNGDDKSVRVKLYHGFTLRCQVNAVPEANITWFKVRFNNEKLKEIDVPST